GKCWRMAETVMPMAAASFFAGRTTAIFMGRVVQDLAWKRWQHSASLAHLPLTASAGAESRRHIQLSGASVWTPGAVRKYFASDPTIAVLRQDARYFPDEPQWTRMYRYRHSGSWPMPAMALPFPCCHRIPTAAPPDKVSCDGREALSGIANFLPWTAAAHVSIAGTEGSC